MLHKKLSSKADEEAKHMNAICPLLGYYAASSTNPLPTFRDNLSVPSSRLLFDFLTLEYGTDSLSRNVSTELPLDAA